MPRPTNTAQRRLQIVEAMQRVMGVTGYERASVAAVAEAAGLAPGLIHYHFGNKQEILIELVRMLGERLDARRREAVEGKGADPVGRLEAWLDAHVSLGPGADPTAVACWVSIGAEAMRIPEVRAVYVEALTRERDQLGSLLSEAVKPVRLPTAKRNQMAAGLLAAIQGAYLLGAAAPEVAPRGFARPALRALLDGLLATVRRCVPSVQSTEFG